MEMHQASQLMHYLHRVSAVQQQKYFRGAAQASLSQCGAVQFSLYNKAFFYNMEKMKMKTT